MSELLERVSRGEKITITRHGVPTAVLVPVTEAAPKLTHQEIVEGMRALRKRVKSRQNERSRNGPGRAAVLTTQGNGMVIDASVALAWCFPDEASDYADAVLGVLEGQSILVPSIWSMEITNALLVGERRKRIRLPDVRQFVELLKRLRIVEDNQPFGDAMSNVLPLAREVESFSL